MCMQTPHADEEIVLQIVLITSAIQTVIAGRFVRWVRGRSRVYVWQHSRAKRSRIEGQPVHELEKRRSPLHQLYHDACGAASLADISVA